MARLGRSDPRPCRAGRIDALSEVLPALKALQCSSTSVSGACFNRVVAAVLIVTGLILMKLTSPAH